MAVWGIDIGQCALKAVKLSYDRSAEKVQALAFDYIEHAKILSQPDADPDMLIRAALDKFVERNDVSGDQLYVGVPGQAGLTRFVKLPPVEPKKIPEIVTFEAKQQIPFPLEDVVWDYQKIGAGDEEEDEDIGLALEQEVGLFALKKDVVRQHLAPFGERGLAVDTVQLAPVSLYNFVAFDHFLREAKRHAAAEEAGEPVEIDEEAGDTLVLLDVGADKTDVVITDGDSMWFRNLPIGGNHFTRALTKELKLTFAKAEHLKRNATKTKDPKALYQAMRPVFQDFANELQRSIGYYQSTHRQNVIKEVLGVGNGFRLQGLQKFLSQSLGKPVNRLRAYHDLVGDDVVKSPAFAENLPSFTVAYGLALQGIGQTPIQTNLLPQEVRLDRLVREKKPWSLAAAAAVLLGFCLVFFGNYRKLSAVERPEFDPQAEGSAVKLASAATTQFQGWQSDFDAKLAAYDKKRSEGDTIIGVDRADQKLRWLQVLDAVNEALPIRDTTTPDQELVIDNVDEINVEYIDAAYTANVGEWWGSAEVNEEKKLSVLKSDRETAPAGEGWWFQLRGHTFNVDKDIFLRNVVTAMAGNEKLRRMGVSHVMLFGTSTDPGWTPAKGSDFLAKVETMRDRFGVAAGAASGGAGGMRGGSDYGDSGYSDSSGGISSAGGSSGGGSARGGMGAGLDEGYGGSGREGYGGSGQEGYGRGGYGGSEGAGEMDEYRGRSMGRAAGSDAKANAFIRTDFAIQFIWQPGKEEAADPAATAPATAASQ